VVLSKAERDHGRVGEQAVLGPERQLLLPPGDPLDEITSEFIAGSGWILHSAESVPFAGTYRGSHAAGVDATWMFTASSEAGGADALMAC
jgi:hypothetical protein